MGENIIMTIGVGITHMNDSNPRGRSAPNVRLGISHQRFRMLYPRFKLLNWEMYLSYMNISPTEQMHVYVHKTATVSNIRHIMHSQTYVILVEHLYESLNNHGGVKCKLIYIRHFIECVQIVHCSFHPLHITSLPT